MSELLLTLLGLAVLVVGAEAMVRGAVDLALRARISPLVIGLTVVSMGTSAPELLVSLMAALKGNSAIAIGNVVGSNIANISLILGLAILIFPIEVDRDARRIHWPVMMTVSLLFWWLFSDDLIARWEGVVFLMALAVYVGWMVWSSRRSSLSRAHEPPRMRWWQAALLLVSGIAALTLGSDWFVDGGVGLARLGGVSEQLIGVTVIAFGTSVPELVTSLVAAFRKQPDISLGNLVGSNVFNLLGIIGVSAAIQPVVASHSAFRIDLLAMLIIALILYPLMRFGKGMGRWQGAVLASAYLAYLLLVLQRG
ncbi:MAG TPA: calcium/sodium antiporter [Flavobacteriales bacterium]|nr:calcium/sodium antiporter [Flavobacteriales bacterium]